MESPYGVMSRPLSKEGKENWDRIFTKEKAMKIDVMVTHDGSFPPIHTVCDVIDCDDCPTQNESNCTQALYELIKREGLILNITAE